MKRLILFLAFTTFGFSQNYYLYVAAESDDTVSLIKFDGKRATELERIPVGIKFAETEGPHGLTVDPSGDYWYLSLAHGNPYGTLTKFSTQTNTEIATTELGYFPATMEISSLTGLLYCVNFKLYGTMTPSSVSVVDPQTMTEITKIPTGVMPHGSRISPDGRFQYSVAMMSGELYEVDTVSLEVNRVLQLDNNHHMDHQGMDHQGMDHHSMNHQGMNHQEIHHSTTQPTWVIPHPSDSKVYIAGNSSNEIIEVDTDSWEIINRFKTGKGPYNIDITSDGKKLVTTLKGEGKTEIKNLKTGKSKIVDNTTKVSHGVVISPDNKYAFVTVEGIGGEPGVLDVIDIGKAKLVSSVKIGKQAGGIAFWKLEQ